MGHRISAVFLMVSWALVLSILLTPEGPDGHGLPHSRFVEMDQGGESVARHESLFIKGWMFGALQIALYVGLLLWSTRKPRPWRPFLVGGLIYEGIFGMMCWAYWKSLSDSHVVFIGPFPASVSWFLFGLWPAPILFIGLYVCFYRRWIFPIESAQALERMLEQRSRS